MIKYIDGTVFNSPAKTIVNTINCVGVMGAGIALEFKLRFPEMYKNYQIRCDEDKVKIGHPYLYKVKKNKWILNFPTKYHWRNPSKIEYIEQGLIYFRNNYQRENFESIAFPKLGTNKGGLEWDQVKPIMEKYLMDLDIPVYIALNEKKEAEGIEKIMLDIINKNLENDCRDIGIGKRQKTILLGNLPYSKLYQISNINGIGEKTYERIFKYYYHQAHNQEENTDQLNFF
ncbi:macro domain-containing protein [Guptibacillus hwajinpoensis]|uniref:macro domain-containing protein n=1 Tax=Guptibacillus hwajinpoensis TaxID=208199 RepID=UPI001CFE8819|nr:macro domain-containing protein [Pseudalkalibacillus hwajinpoensis]WLR60158.1 macro domain-containing protein [Pseudalkalibacillus hwajinpoensis]